MQYENTQYEESIDLLALLASALRKWKWLVAAVLIGAVLLGAYKGVLKPETISHADEIAELQKALDDSNSKLTANEAEITANENNIAANLEKIAANEELLVTQRESQAALEETLEALRASLERSQTVLADPTANVEETAAVIVQLPTLTNEITEANSRVSSAAQEVRTTRKEITTWQAEIETMTAQNEALVKTNEDLRKQITRQQAEIEGLSDTSAGIKPVLKFAVLGGVLGVFVFCGVIFLQYMLNQKLRNSEELNERYHLSILGEFCSPAVHKHNRFEKMLDKLEGDVQTMPEEQEVYELIAASIQAPAAPLPVRLAVTGTVEEGTLREVGDRLSSLLPEGYDVAVAANPVYNAAFLAGLKQYTVLLVEEKRVSDKREIAKLAEVLYRNEVRVIGAVVK